MTQDLFTHAASKDMRGRPLAERMRPQKLEEVVGQQNLLGPGKALAQLVARGEVPSMILWGPPGTGKTTVAQLLARAINAQMENLSAVLGGVKELRAAVERAEQRRAMHRARTLLFVDEIHRFNKAQQDALLPHVESGAVILVGATTENPSFEINSALLSRCRIFTLQPLPAEAQRMLLRRALQDRDRGLGSLSLHVDDGLLDAIVDTSFGDARRALTTLEVAAQLCVQEAATELQQAHVEQAAQTKLLTYDKGGDEHYHVISAFIKSMRGSDLDAAVYYLARLLEAGEPPRFVLRRMVIFASEDVGNADPQALQVAINALHAFELVGMPEGVLPLTQAATYLACAPKSNTAVTAYGAARDAVKKYGALPVPAKLRNAPTPLMKSLGHGANYQYPHDFTGHYVRETYLPDALVQARFYEPSDQGAEAAIAAHLARLRAPLGA